MLSLWIPTKLLKEPAISITQVLYRLLWNGFWNVIHPWECLLLDMIQIPTELHLAWLTTKPINILPLAECPVVGKPCCSDALHEELLVCLVGVNPYLMCSVNYHIVIISKF